MDRMETREMISALADGQLRGGAFAQGVQAACEDASAREAWRTYHLIGDVLRSNDLASGSSSERFLARLQVRLESEAVSEPMAVAGEQTRSMAVPAAAANDGLWRWKLFAGAASVAAVAAVGWNLISTQLAPSTGGAQLAAAPAASAVLAEPGVAQGPMIRDARLDQFLAAHRQLGGATALQTPAGFLRNATFDAPAR